MNPHHSRKRVIEAYGYKWDNPKEAERYQYLKLRERAREIRDLEVKPEIRLTINGIDVGKYTPEFRYFDIAKEESVIEDCKDGYWRKKKQTKRGIVVREWKERAMLCAPDWPWRKKVIEACIGQTITEVWE